MAALTHETSAGKPARNSIVSRLLIREFWGALCIVAMWLAVLFDGVFGADIISSQPTGFTRIPSAIVVAFFASLASWAVAKRTFGRPAPPE